VERHERTTLTIEFRALLLAFLSVVVLFGLLLYLLPSATATYWAWNIANPRSSILIGAVYMAAIAYILLVLRENDWSQVQNRLGAFIVFSLVLLCATAVHWESFKAYYPTTLVWQAFYYSAPLLIPLIARLQIEPAGSAAITGPQITRGWRDWLIARGIFYSLLALLIFVFADSISTIWPWSIDPLDLRVFTGQVAIIGWDGFAALRGKLLWRGHRLGLIFIGSIGFLQLVGLLLGMTPYHWSSVIGIVLPLMFLEWIMTPLLMFATQRRRNG
jgi:hypothetical protein